MESNAYFFTVVIFTLKGNNFELEIIMTSSNEVVEAI